ncbi:uncharacterized protein BX664DRAFT_328994 [Halteromyces radiatus]|uniref:uncharacterized protein n=1 Tax=Halteromyces radiatus TaxID=101107 RepID=UPI00221EA712|nr:uncharacterized protein BX664DRAFT_328994 [Halteromyces radiatus]KAI8093129.1 hypothetical protein BX664DRAFT_328994 [Halteromyces radiatus]
MTIEEFPLGYFYIVSQLNGLVLDVHEDDKGQAIIVTSVKLEKSPERDSQLWMHQDGFLTNKAAGLVLDIGRAGTFKAIFTAEERLFLDQMKEAEEAHDQRFGYDGQYIYNLNDSNVVIDIRKSDTEAGARVIVYKRKEGDENLNQRWTIELGDPPKAVDPEEEEDGKAERLQAWFGNWFGWGDKKKHILKEEELDHAHKKVYHEKKSHASHQLLAGAVAYQAVKIWEKQQEEKGEEVSHGTLKKVVASIAAAELVKLIEERGGQDDEEDDDEDKKQQKKGMMESMATSAAMNLIESKYGMK